MKLVMLQDIDPRMLGFLPGFLDERDPASAKDQFDKNYQHGGGWQSFDGFVFDPVKHTLKYPGDLPYIPLARMMLRDETIYFYNHAWVAIVQPDGSFDVARMD